VSDDIDPERLARCRELAERDYLGDPDETMVPYPGGEFDAGYDPT
jgi:hypothetical protein